MATSSITRNFVITGQKQAQMFVDAIEYSASNRPVQITVSAKELTDKNDIIKVMKKRKKMNATQR